MRFFTAVAAVLMMAGTAGATITHVVGGDLGWTVPQNVTYYDEWAKGRVFGVGDKLLFSYKPPSDNVMMMKRDDYERCSQHHPINSFYTGQTVLDLDTAGDYYFLGGVGLHCKLGERMHVHVIDGPGKPGVGDFNFHFHPYRQLAEVASVSASAPSPSPTGADVSGGSGSAPAGSGSGRVAGVDATLVSFVCFFIYALLLA